MIARARQFWALCSNPDYYRIEDAIAEVPLDNWVTKGSEIRAGDRAIIWKAKGHSGTTGIVALAEVVRDPEAAPDLHPEYQRYPVASDETSPLDEMVLIRYIRAPGLPMWLDGDHHTLLSELSIVRGGARRSVYRIEIEQWERIVEAAGGWPHEIIIDEADGEVGHLSRQVTARQVSESTTWMFQYKVYLPPPRKGFDLLNKIARGHRRFMWRAMQHRSKLHTGERVYFLRGAGRDDTQEAAIVAVGTTLSNVTPSEEFYPWGVEVLFEALVDPPLTRAEMRHDPILGAYAPFATGSQGTQFPLPQEVAVRTAELVRDRLTPLSAEAAELAPPSEGVLLPIGTAFGGSYRLADEEYSTTMRELIRPDAGRIERANQSHAKLQNQLASHLKSKGLAPRSYGIGEPNFDIGWVQGETIFIAEVKSLTEDNEEMQLRLGLAQALMYRHRIARKYAGIAVKAVLLVEREPTFDLWESLCTELEVLLIWPEILSERL